MHVITKCRAFAECFAVDEDLQNVATVLDVEHVACDPPRTNTCKQLM